MSGKSEEAACVQSLRLEYVYEKQSGGPWIGLQSESKGSVPGDMIMWGHCKIFGFYSELGRLRITLVPVLTADVGGHGRRREIC